MVITRILVGDDASAGAATARAWAAAMANGLDALITTVRVFEYPTDAADPGVESQRVGEPVPELLAAAEDAEADLIVVGRRGSGGFGALALGSTAHQLTEHSTRPVAVVPSDREPLWPFTQVAVGHDGSATAAGAVRWTAALAAVAGAEATVIHAIDMGPAYAMAGLDDAYAESRARIADVVEREWCAPLREAGVAYSAVIEEGGASSVMLDAARVRGLDLLVVGRRSGAVPGLAMGSVAHRALGFAPCPTVVVPEVA
jgi:nucleotide-binding universal stress UspA family protein